MFPFPEKPICHNPLLIFSKFIQQTVSSGFFYLKQQPVYLHGIHSSSNEEFVVKNCGARPIYISGILIYYLLLIIDVLISYPK
jgi:hypothetical protein